MSSLGKLFVFALALVGSAGLVAGPAAAAEPGSGKAEIVFSSDGSIVSILADGSERKAITPRRPKQPSWLHDEDISPRISPDGARLLFLRTDETTDDLYKTDLMVANRDGSGATSIDRATAGDGRDETAMISASWSADSRRVYLTELTYRRDLLTSRVVVMDANGAGRRVLAKRSIDFKALAEQFENGQTDLSGVWFYTQAEEAPDGNRVLLSSAGYFLPGLTGKLRVLDLATGKARVIQRSGSAGTWSHDGTRIAFVSERRRREKDCYEGSCSFQSDIFLMDADGGNPRRLIRDRARGNEFAPSWSGDDTRILFTSDRNHPRGLDANELYSVRTDGTCLTWLTNGAPSSSYGSWAPEPLDADPGACGAAGREPLVEFAPPRRAAGGPTYWLGKDFDGLLPSYFSGAGHYLEYGDCAFFAPSRCARLHQTVITNEKVCRGDLHWSLEWGRFRGMAERRGALVARSAYHDGRPDELIVNTGTRSVGIVINRLPARSGFGPHRAAFRKLVPVAAEQRVGTLPAAVLSRRDVRKASRIARRVRRGDLDPGGPNSTYRAYLRFHRAVRRAGNPETIPCAGRRRRDLAGPSINRTLGERASAVSVPSSAHAWAERIAPEF